MRTLPAFAASLALLAPGEPASAQPAPAAPPAVAAVRVRYIVDEVAPAVAFYAKLGFKPDLPTTTYFAALSRGGVQLLISPTKGPGGASQPMPDGRRPAPGGWNRIVIYVTDIAAETERLRKEGVRFRGEIITGLGGKEILLDDPSGNPVELFQPT